MNKNIVGRNISMRFGNDLVLDDINFKVNDGEFLSILGPSGCGKTTLLRILIGLLNPTEGKLIKGGVDITNFHPSKRGMGIVFQNYALFENMTVLKNVQYALRFNEELKDNREQIAMDMLKQVGLENHIKKKPRKLSGGQKQRVAIARTLATNPDVMLFDEPMSALDVETRLQLRGELKNIQKKFGTTMIYITHDQEEAFAMSDRVMVFGGGKIQQIDTPEEIILHPANEYIENFVVKNIKIKIDSLSKYRDIIEMVGGYDES